MTHTGTSFPEKSLFYYISKLFPDAISRYRVQTEEGSFETDVFVPSIKTAIEYDGYNWHKNKKEQDIRKNHALNNVGIYVIRIREFGLPLLPDFNGEVITVAYAFIGEIRTGIVNSCIKTLSGIIEDKELRKKLLSFHLSEEQLVKDEIDIYSLVFNYPADFPTMDDFCGSTYFTDSFKEKIELRNIPLSSNMPLEMVCPMGIQMKYISTKDKLYKDKCNNRLNRDCELCKKKRFCFFYDSCALALQGECNYIRDKGYYD